ncbi:ATPase, aaa-2 [Grosmannia clavigera kw1407]|uniref:ATPase, aaa-2 n=1 Tax=Grosmannia clavigera (strain kw1407 / UAMH 11150) TaxID=655863 RepID=F0XIA1_GROCL|nr:ATPase, aaa-2 [Grosmannia clavigera kw1407]EFX02940.1 ATPase, aaa-2 [Grosmannia clavigera kw1407]
MAENRNALIPAPTMDSQLAYIMKECGCDEKRAKMLLAMSKQDPLKAVSHQKKLLAVLARQGHSQALPTNVAPESQKEPVPFPITPPTPPTPPFEGEELGNSDDDNVAASVQDRTVVDATPIPTATIAAESSFEKKPMQSIEATKTPEWNFQLPRLPEEDAAQILSMSEYGGGTRNSQGLEEGETAAFDLGELCAGVQQGASILAIRTYLQGFPNANIEARINGTIEGIPSVFYAVESNDPAMLRLWASYGADVSVIHPTSGTPLLAYAVILSELLDGRDTSPVVATLLSLGASPKSIPDAFYVKYNRDLSEDELLQNVDGLDGGSAKIIDVWKWCKSPSVRKKMARTTDLTQRYYLDRATKLKRAGVRHRQVAVLRNAEAILGIQYHLIGQTVAANHLLRKLMTYITVPSKRPLVLVFAGPSGHGKTELARQLGNLLGLALQVVDCTIFNEEREMFGPRAPYVGCERGSPLNNFIAHNAGQRSVVFLDEFEKASKKIHQALLLPFDSGDYQDRRSLGKVDCSRTIWILATNALDETILQFCSAHPAILQQDSADVNNATTKHLTKKLSKELRSAFLDHFGAPITGRVSDFIPFVPFSKGEQAVVAHKFLLELAENVAQPVLIRQGAERAQLLGNVRLHVRHDASVCARLAEAEYSEELGARSLRKAVEHVQDGLVESYLEDDEEIEEGDGTSKTDFIVDVRADEIVVRKQATEQWVE